MPKLYLGLESVIGYEVANSNSSISAEDVEGYKNLIRLKKWLQIFKMLDGLYL